MCECCGGDCKLCSGEINHFLQAEYGSSHTVDMLLTTLVDNEGKAIEQPICKTCGQGKVCLLGSKAYMWICNECDSKPKDAFLMTQLYYKSLTS